MFPMAKVITGILAHVDAGKTTLSEALLYTAGTIRKLGRVDTKDCFLDNNNIERERGITIFAKQAELSDRITLIDTPGHIDFISEIQRTLCVMDVAILMVNASDGIQSNTKALWTLLRNNNIPAVIFVNKMDMDGADKEKILCSLKTTFSESIIDFDRDFADPALVEEIASFDDTLMEKYLDGGNITSDEIRTAVSESRIYPCIFGSALRMQGVDRLLYILNECISIKNYPQEFACVAYKISKDKSGNRLTHLKILGGELKVKDFIHEEKVNEIRIYSGEKYQSVKSVQAGEVCTVTGLKESYAGRVYGNTSIEQTARTDPALIYSVSYPSNVNDSKMLHILKEVEEELPEINVSYDEGSGQFHLKLMGQIQTEVLKQLIADRYNVSVDFGEGRIAYKETIREEVIGVGHYEPLRHYAEVHLKLSPLPRGSGLEFVSDLSVDVLDTNWQRLILTHLQEKQHIGVLTGSPITDMRIEVIAGRAHLKHTEGGDFRQSTYRAIRHGLMQSESVLLEPFYDYEITVPENCTGRVMADMQKMSGSCNIADSKGGFTTLTGRVSVKESQNYMTEVRAYSKGQGTLSFSLAGYDLCHNTEEVIQQIGYDAESDIENTADSVFCSHGAGFNVNWKDVTSYMHIKD